jgi:hypothetical protein
MSFVGQVLWNRKVVVWARETIGNPSAAVPAVAAAALERNFRRVGAASFFRTSITISLVVPARMEPASFKSSHQRCPVGAGLSPLLGMQHYPSPHQGILLKGALQRNR